MHSTEARPCSSTREKKENYLFRFATAKQRSENTSSETNMPQKLVDSVFHLRPSQTTLFQCPWAEQGKGKVSQLTDPS